MSNSDTPAIITDASTIVVAIAGFISTAWQAGRVQRAEQKASLYAQKKDLYIRTIRALHSAQDARTILKVNLDEHAPVQIVVSARHEHLKLCAEAEFLLPEIVLLAPHQIFGAVGDAITEVSDVGKDMEAQIRAEALISADLNDHVPKRWLSRKPDFNALLERIESSYARELAKRAGSDQSQ